MGQLNLPISGTHYGIPYTTPQISLQRRFIWKLSIHHSDHHRQCFTPRNSQTTVTNICSTSTISHNPRTNGRVWMFLVFVSPVSRPQKDRNQTRPRLEKTGPAVRSFDFWESKTAKRPVFMDRSLRFRPIWTGEFVLLTFPYKMSPRSLKTVKTWLRNKLNYTMLTKIVDFTEYYCRIFNFQPYWAFLGSFESLN